MRRDTPLVAACIWALAAAAHPAESMQQASAIQIHNSHAFAVNMPLRVRGAGEQVSEDLLARKDVQRDGEDLVVQAEIAPTSSEAVQIESPEPKGLSERTPVTLTPVRDSGEIEIKAGEAPQGRLSWSLLVRPMKKAASARSTASIEEDEEDKGAAIGGGDSTAWKNGGTSAPLDFAAVFDVLPLRFSKVATDKSPLFDTWSAAPVTTLGLEINVRLDAYRSGVLDSRVTLKNTDVSTTSRQYCALICKWSHPPVSSRFVDYDNHRSALGAPDETTITRFRAGASHHWALARGLDWIRLAFKETKGASAATWMNDFTPSWQVFAPGRAARGTRPATPGKWVTANGPCVAQELEATSTALYSISEITRGNIARFRDRYQDYVMPPPGKSVELGSRWIFQNSARADSDPDGDTAAGNAFIAYAGNQTTGTGTLEDGKRVLNLQLGYPSIKFETSYFPYSTLGENFDRFKLPGQDREGYWPLSADTVINWKLFADDIRRDLAIAKSFRFDVIRLHHLELVYQSEIPQAARREYLDFLFDEMRRLGLKALADIQVKPEEAKELVARYGDVLAGVEVENEVLIWGIKEGREKYWNSVYDAVKSVNPAMPVHLTSHANVGIFDQLDELGGKSDRMGLHSYQDGLDAVPSGRDVALAFGNVAGKRGKAPLITEWNWRFMTRLPDEERAKYYKDIIGNALTHRAISEFGQFQFNETLAINPRVGLSGIRNYEPLYLSRRPKPEAFELMKLIDQYSDPSSRSNAIVAGHGVAQLDKQGRGKVTFKLSSRDKVPLKLRSRFEAWGGLKAVGKVPDALTFNPGEDKNVTLDVKAEPALPGFYHAFLRLEEGESTAPLRYAWSEARLAGSPAIDFDTPTTVTYFQGVKGALSAFDFTSRPLVVVYPDAAGETQTKDEILLLESAIVLQKVLEAATGQAVGLYESRRLPDHYMAENAGLFIGQATNIWPLEVTNAYGNDPLENHDAIVYCSRKLLALKGRDAQRTSEAVLDLALRIWRGAKDSAVRRLGGKLVERALKKGSDPTKLP